MAEVKAVAAIAAKWWKKKITDNADFSNNNKDPIVTSLLGSVLETTFTPEFYS